MLKLSVEQKGVVVPTGELTVFLDGLTVSHQEELAPLTNGNAANGTSELSIHVHSGYVVWLSYLITACTLIYNREIIMAERHHKNVG